MKHSHEDYPVCPHCGHEEKEWYDKEIDLDDGGITTIECNACDTAFIVTTHLNFSFSTEKFECEEDKHEWGPGKALRIEQETCERWNAANFFNRTDHKPKTIWSRTCAKCDAEEYHHLQDGAEHAFDSTDPWQGVAQ